MSDKTYKTVEKHGVTVAIVNGKKVLLLKRISLPFMVNPGIWYFVGGGRKHGETPLQNAYREVEEELRIGRDRLEVLARSSIVVRDQKRRQEWKNGFFVMRSRDKDMKLNFENRDYRWVTASGLMRYGDLLGALGSADRVIEMIRFCLKGTRPKKG